MKYTTDLHKKTTASGLMLAFTIIVFVAWWTQVLPTVVYGVTGSPDDPLLTVCVWIVAAAPTIGLLLDVSGNHWATLWNAITYLLFVPILGYGFFLAFAYFMFTASVAADLSWCILFYLAAIIAIALDVIILLRLFREKRRSK